jgi:hypothetical protein
MLRNKGRIGDAHYITARDEYCASLTHVGAEARDWRKMAMAARRNRPHWLPSVGSTFTIAV